MKKLLFLLFAVAMVACDLNYDASDKLFGKCVQHRDGALTVVGEVKNADQFKSYAGDRYSDITAVIPTSTFFGGIEAEGKYDDGKFRITLPAKIDENRMHEDYFREGIDVSNPNAKIFGIDYFIPCNGGPVKFVQYLQSGIHLDYYKYDTDGQLQESANALWYYVDSNNLVKGTISEVINDEMHFLTYDLNLKRGWNMVYKHIVVSYDDNFDMYVRNERITSKQPNVPLEWIVR